MPVAAILYELLRMQSGHATLQQGNLLTTIAGSVGDNIQRDDITIQGFRVLSKLNAQRDISPLDGVILSVLRARWNTNTLTPQLCSQGHLYRREMYIAGTILDSQEVIQIIQLTAEVIKGHFAWLTRLRHLSPVPRSWIEEKTGPMAEHRSFLQTGSLWLQEIAIDSMSNWSFLNKLTTELILETMVLMQDDPITCSNCMGTLYLLSSEEKICGKITGLGGVGKIVDLLPRQFPDGNGLGSVPGSIYGRYSKLLRDWEGMKRRWALHSK